MDNPFNLPALRRVGLFCFVVAVFHSLAVAGVVAILLGGRPIWWPGKSVRA